MSEDPTDFDVRLWLVELNLSDAGLKKVLNNKVTDQECLVQLTLSDVNQLKLGVGDRRRLIGGIDILRKTVSTVIGAVENPKLPEDSSNSDSTPGATPPATPSAPGVADGSNPSSDVQGSSSGVQVPSAEVPLKTSFTIEEVSSFLAGNVLPANLQASVAQTRQFAPSNFAIDNSSVVQNNSDVGRPPFLPPHFPPLANQVRHHQQLQQSSYQRQPLMNQQQFPSTYGAPLVNQQQLNTAYGGQSTVPLYTPQRPSFIPSRLGHTSRDRVEQQYSDAYQSASMHDLLAINDNNFRSGEALFLPCNFVSHVRGSSRSEDEELLTTVSGAKLYFSNTNRKIQPEKLSYGLIFGANARILARLIPNLTPDLAAY